MEDDESQIIIMRSMMANIENPKYLLHMLGVMKSVLNWYGY